MIDVSTMKPWALVVHGGAGKAYKNEKPEELLAGIEKAFRSGESVLAAGGSALDAVCAAVVVLEDEPVFNAGRGAALTSDGTAEHDASVMTGDGTAGAVAVCKSAKNPVLAARAVKERSEHVLLVTPPEQLLSHWGIETAPPDYFVTEMRLEQLRELQAEERQGPRHGTVGAVALDGSGRLAAATSTGGIINQSVGRVGDSPIVGAGTFAKDGVVAVSCTGAGEAFMQGVVAHQVAARLEYGSADLAEAAETALASEITGRGELGGLIAVDASGRIVVVQNSPRMVSAWREGDRILSKV